MKTKLILAVCMLFLLIGMASAITQNFESAATARIVGDYPAEMTTQMQDTGDINLEKGIYSGGVSNPSVQREDSYDILKKIFSDFVNLYNPPFSEISSALDNNNDNLLVFNPLRKFPSMTEIENTDADDFEGISSILKRNDNLIVLNSPYAGLYIPYENSFAASINTSPLIAPMSYSSDMFVKAFVCNIGRNDTLGEAYRQARNNYYWNTNDRNELIGLTLMSYMLYGMPTRTLNAPSASLSSYCKDYQNDFDTDSLSVANIQEESIRLTQDSGIYEKNLEFDINSYEIVNHDNFSLIETDSTMNALDLFELVLPFRVLEEKFPMEAIITGFNLTELSNPVDITVSDLPEFDGYNLINRSCYEDSQEAGIDFSKAYNGNSLSVLARINPVQVINCTEGKFRLYKTVKYKIEYAPYSPILIESIHQPGIILPEQQINISAELKNIQISPTEGYLAIRDESGNILNAKQITADTGIFDIGFEAPQKEGTYNYRLDFYKGSDLNESITYKEFNFIVSTIEINLIAPEIAASSAEIIVILLNNFNTTTAADLDYQLIQENNVEYSNIQEITLEPGLNTFTLTFNNLNRNKVIYDVLVGITYLDTYQTASASILTEHVPVIMTNKISVRENETLDISPEIYDIDGDEISISIDSPIENNSLIDFDSSGVYDIEITADDGIKQTTKTIALTIENTNRAPMLGEIEKITGKEGGTIIFNPSYSDPDNENAVTNDDNNLTINSDGFINSTGQFDIDYDVSGNYTLLVSVSDGEYTDSKEVEIEIANTNRAPEIIADEITISENSVLNISDYAFDVDNNNSVSNDDNNLSLTYSDLFDESGMWDITYEDAGVYDVNVSVSDGEFSVSKIMTINVTNLNRAPMIERLGRSKYYIPENSDLLLQVNASDLDKDDIFDVSWYLKGEKLGDGNKFTFSANETIVEYDINVVASDGYLTNETIFDVVVSDVPVFDGLDGDTSKLNASELNSIYLILEKAGKVKIIFQEPVDLSDTVDFVNTVILDTSYASLDDEFLEVLKGIPAHVIFYNLNIAGNPVIYYNEDFNSEADSICPSSICSNIKYDSSTKILEFDVAHFSTYGIQGKEQNQFSLDASNITIEDPLTGEIFETFLIKNNGLGDLDNLAISAAFNPGFDLDVSPKLVSLPSQGAATITIFGNIMSIISDEIVEAGTITFKDNDFERNINFYIKPVDAIRISNLDIDVGEKSYNNLEDGDDIKVLPGKEMTIKIEIENLYPLELDSDIEIELNIDEFDFEKTMTFDLNNDDKRTREISFIIPEELSKDEYELEIKLNAKTETKPDSNSELEIELDYDKDNKVTTSAEQILEKETDTEILSIHGKSVFSMFELEDLSPEFILIMFLLLNIILVAIIITYFVRK